jgi:hypothetical protein
MNWTRSLAAAAVVSIGLASRVSAQSPCADLGDRVVIGAGGSASTALLKAVGTALHAIPDPITLVYQSPGACYGIYPFVDGSRITGTATYWDASGTQQTCSLPAAGAVPDFGMLGTSATLCSGVSAIPGGIGDFAGPVTSWSLIVPTASTESVISAEAAYLIYGFGAQRANVSPWNDPAFLWGRNSTSAALIAIATAVNVPPERFASNFSGDFADHDVGTNGMMISRVATSSNANAALGFVSTEVAEAGTARTQVRTLAYQAFGQSCGYTPNSSATVFDKSNVRDGHYYLWSSYHFYAPVDGIGAIADPDTRRFIEFFTRVESAPPELPILDIISTSGTIPECAMNVWRDTDLGPLYSRAPASPCGCYYEFHQTGTTGCQTCETSADCGGSSVCRFGFCEVN